MRHAHGAAETIANPAPWELAPTRRSCHGRHGRDRRGRRTRAPDWLGPQTGPEAQGTPSGTAVAAGASGTPALGSTAPTATPATPSPPAPSPTPRLLREGCRPGAGDPLARANDMRHEVPELAERAWRIGRERVVDQHVPEARREDDPALMVDAGHTPVSQEQVIDGRRCGLRNQERRSGRVVGKAVDGYDGGMTERVTVAGEEASIAPVN